MLQGVRWVLVVFDDGLQTSRCGMTLGQLGGAARADRTAYRRRKPGSSVPLIAHDVPVEYETFLAGSGRQDFVRKQRRLHALGRIARRWVDAVRVAPVAAILWGGSSEKPFNINLSVCKQTQNNRFGNRNYKIDFNWSQLCSVR